MFNLNHRSLKTKKDPQQFLQYEIGEDRFKMILVNESKKSFVPVTPNLPSGFKPLSSSTPKKSRKSFEIVDKQRVTMTKLSPAPRLKMSQFIGEIPNPSEKSNQNIRLSNKKNINFNKPASKNLEIPIIPNVITNNAVHVKSQRSTSCQSWDSFQKQLRKILNYTVKDLNITEKILKLILQFNSHSNEKKRHNKHYQKENLKIFENYVKIKALVKASESAADDWNKCEEKFLDNTKNEEESDNKNKFVISSKNVGSFKVPEVPFFSEPSVKSNSNESAIIIENDITTTAVDKSTQPNIISFTDYNTTSEDIMDSILEFNSSSKNYNHQKNQTDEVFKNLENFVDSKICTATISNTIDDFSIFKKIFPETFETEENVPSFKVPEAPIFSKPANPKNSCFKTKRTQNHKMVASPYFGFNETLEQKQTSSRHSLDSKGKNSQFEKELQKLLNTTTRGSKQLKKVLKAPLYTKPAVKPSSKDFEIHISNDIKTIANGKPQLSNAYSKTTEEILEWIFQYNSFSKNSSNQKNHSKEISENFLDGNVSTMLSKTIEDLSIFKEIFPCSIESKNENDQSMLSSKAKFGLFKNHNFDLN